MRPSSTLLQHLVYTQLQLMMAGENRPFQKHNYVFTQLELMSEMYRIFISARHLHVKVDKCNSDETSGLIITCMLTFFMKCVCGSDNSLHDVIARGQCTLKQL